MQKNNTAAKTQTEKKAHTSIFALSTLQLKAVAGGGGAVTDGPKP